MAVRGVLAEADVGDEHERFRGGGLLERAQAALHDAVVDPGAGAVLVFFGGKAEEQEAADAECGAGLGFLHGFVDGEVEDAGHGGDFAANAFALAEEERVDEGAGVQVRLAHERTHGRCGAQPPQPCRGKVHGFSLASPMCHQTRSSSRRFVSSAGSGVRNSSGLPVRGWVKSSSAACRKLRSA